MTTFDAAARADIAAEWRRQAAEPIPPNAGPVGCAAAIVAGVAVAVLRAFHLHFPFQGLVLAVLAVVIVAGVVFSQFGGSEGRNLMRGRVAEAIAALKGNRDDAAWMRAAVALTFNASDARGPASSTLYDAADVARQLEGPALEYVRAVEHVLRDEVGAAPVFSPPRA